MTAGLASLCVPSPPPLVPVLALLPAHHLKRAHVVTNRLPFAKPGR